VTLGAHRVDIRWELEAAQLMLAPHGQMQKSGSVDILMVKIQGILSVDNHQTAIEQEMLLLRHKLVRAGSAHTLDCCGPVPMLGHTAAAAGLQAHTDWRWCLKKTHLAPARIEMVQFRL
jgi:hypothetical protein